MKVLCQKRALKCAVEGAQAAGQIMRENLRAPKKINLATRYDIKLELDVECQRQIEKILLSAFPEVSVLGEEGSVGAPNSRYRWVVDPIDGTVNFTYGIPHACVSIALQAQSRDLDLPDAPNGRQINRTSDGYTTLVGVVYDPFCDELWTAGAHEPARLNGSAINVSSRKTLGEAIVSIGFAKKTTTLNEMLPVMSQLAHEVRKIRIMGAAALAMVYVATGRLDAYLETGIRLWDIAAGGLILQSAGGEFWHRSIGHDHTYRVVANNGLLRSQLQQAISTKRSRRV